jgi:hypothetical protein
MSVSKQNPDGSWSPAEPMGWQPGLDTEIYHDELGWRAEVYDEDVPVAVIYSRTRFMLMLRLGYRIRKLKKLGMGS